MKKKIKVCLIGYSGSLNRHIIEYFKSKCELIVVSRNKHLTKNEFKIIKSDIKNWNDKRYIPKEIFNTDIIINAASTNDNKKKEIIKKTNIDPLNNLLLIVKKNNIHYLHISSFTTNYFATNSNHLRNNYYLYSKYRSEIKVSKLFKVYKKITILKPTTLYGHSTKKNLFSNILNKKKKYYHNIDDNIFNLVSNINFVVLVYNFIKLRKYGKYEIVSEKMTSLIQILKEFKKYKNINYTNLVSIDKKFNSMYPDLYKKILIKKNRILLKDSLNRSIK